MKVTITPDKLLIEKDGMTIVADYYRVRVKADDGTDLSVPQELVGQCLKNPVEIANVLAQLERTKGSLHLNYSGLGNLTDAVHSAMARDPKEALGVIEAAVSAKPTKGEVTLYRSGRTGSPAVVLTDGERGPLVKCGNAEAGRLALNIYVNEEDTLGEMSYKEIVEKKKEIFDFYLKFKQQIYLFGSDAISELLQSYISDRPTTEKFLTELSAVFHTAMRSTRKAIVTAFLNSPSDGFSALEAYRKKARKRLEFNDAILAFVNGLKSEGSIDLRNGYLVKGRWDTYLVSGDGRVFSTHVHRDRRLYETYLSGEFDKKLENPDELAEQHRLETVDEVAKALAKRHPELVLVMKAKNDP